MCLVVVPITGGGGQSGKGDTPQRRRKRAVRETPESGGESNLRFHAQASGATKKRTLSPFLGSQDRVSFTPGRPGTRVGLGYQTCEVAAQERRDTPGLHIK
jgi:hypothetical protein